MSFYLMLSRNSFFDRYDNIRREIYDLLDMIESKDIKLYLVTRNQYKYKKIINEFLPNNDKILYGDRGYLSGKVITNNQNVMLIGAVDEDIRIAANNKILLINPIWLDVEPNIQQYGFKLKNFKQIIQCIDILSLDNQLFHYAQIDDNTRLIAVSNANSYYAVKNEREMIDNYKKTLKYGNNYYKYAVYFHYLTMIIGMQEFKDVDFWMAVPSSTGSNDNNIYDIVKQTRYLLNNKRSRDLFIRHTPAEKSTYMDPNTRLQEGCGRHLNTIHLNPYYKGKLKGAKVCVLDDYVTNGPSFESVRNLLKHEGVREIILVAIGSFKKPYQKEVMRIEGNVYKPGYSYKSIHREMLKIPTNEKSSEIINHIYEIIKN